MKLINNCTDLSNADIGIILDKIIKDLDTIYYGKVDSKKFIYNTKIINVNIFYKKRYVRFDFYESRR